MSVLMSNYPNGFANGVSIRGVPLSVSHPGSVFWVHSGTGSNGNAGTYQRPFASIDFAVGRCTANKGDIIYVLPGHTETVIAAGGLDLDVAGIAIIGLGAGSNRPTVSFGTATTADMDVDAANISMYNILFTGDVDALAAPIDVNAADFSLVNCEFRDVTGQATDVILTDNNADRLYIDGWTHRGAAAAGGASAIALVGSDYVTIKNFWIDGNFSVGAIDIRTTAVTNLTVRDGFIHTRNAADIAIVDTITASSGAIGPGLQLWLTDNAANITEAITGATFVVFDDVLVVNLAGEKGMLINWTASTDA
jgi:hypothetical protein